MPRDDEPWGKPLDRATSFRMSRVGSRDTLPERRLRSLLHRRGHRFRVHMAPEPSLRRRADIVFTKARVAIFVDGCFWHGCPEHATWPRNNAELWRAKIETNRSRDHETTTRLAAAGWVVVRVWEHEDVESAIARIEEAIAKATEASIGAAANVRVPDLQSCTASIPDVDT